MDLISIIVPVYNAEEYLSECIKSLINQTYKNIEIILINDGSEDNSLEICYLFAECDNRIKVINQVNQGVSAARNMGIDQANGNYITFVDSDDYVKKDYCTTMLSAICNYKTDLVYFGQYSLDNNKLMKIHSRIDEGVYYKNDILRNIIDDGNISGFLLHSSCAVLYKSEILEKENIRYDQMIHYNEDGYFNLLYCLKSETIYINQNMPIYFYRTNLKSASHKIVDIEKKYEILHKRIEQLDTIYPAYDFGLQLKRRRLKLVLEQVNQMLYLPRKEWINKAKEICSSDKTKEALSVIDKNKMDLNKKILFELIRKNKACLLYLYLKHIRPFLKKVFKR